MLEFRLGGREIWQLRLIFGLGIVLPLSVLALVAAKTRGMGFILPGSVVTTFAIYVLLFGFAFLLLSRPDWAIVRSDAIIWRRSIFPMRTLRWLDVGDVALVPGDVFSIFDRAGRRVRRLSQIILGLKGKVEIGVVTDELQRRWLTCVDRHLRSTEASCVAPEPDAGAIRKLMDLGTPSRCPACRGPLTREANGAVLCTRRTHAWPSGTLLFPAVARPVDRLKVLWVLLYAAAGAGFLFFFSDEPVVGSGFCGAVLGVLIAKLVLSSLNPLWRGRRILAIDDRRIRWQGLDRRLVEQRWDEVDSIACVPDANTVFLRRCDGGLLPIPSDFVPKGCRGSELARLLTELLKTRGGRGSPGALAMSG